MAEATLWFLIVGGMFLAVAITGSFLKRLPLSTAMIYLFAGWLLGPAGMGLIERGPLRDSGLLEVITEIAVIISLFTAGLKLRLPFFDRGWLPAIRLASVSMILTIAGVVLIGVEVLGLSLGASVLLGAVLAPTDPVLASDVQLEHPYKTDALRFSLTGEAGLNDGAAFPFVMLGLGLLGLHELGEYGWRWVVIDVAWAVIGGVAIGGALGFAVARGVLYLRREHQEAVGLDDFITIGLIATAYGLALLCSAYGFLAVFAAGLALRHVERSEPADRRSAKLRLDQEPKLKDVATDREHAPAYMAHAVLHFNEQLERIAEIAVVVLIGAAISIEYFSMDTFWLVVPLMLVVRPLAVHLGLLGSRVSWRDRTWMGWFGIRGIGSLYYLTYAIGEGLPYETSERLTELVLITVASSIVIHGVTVTPLMAWRERQQRRTVTAPDSAR